MIPPQELKNKSFSRAAKGYDAAEVDEYMDFIVEKYSEIFAQCAKYDKKLRVVSARISEIQQEEELMRRLSVSTQKNCDRLTAEAEEEAKNIILRARETAGHIIGEAKENAQAALEMIEQKALMQIESTQKKSDALLLSARTRCTKLLGEFKKEIAIQSENIAKIKNVSEDFNSKLLSMYKNHLNLLSENTSIPNVDLAKFTESGLFDSVMREIKSDAGEIAKKNTGVEYDFESELETLRASKSAISDVKTEEEADESPKIPESENPYDAAMDDGKEDDSAIFDEPQGFETAFSPPEREFAENPYAPKNKSAKDEDDFAEKPLATYDSDDYVYEDDEQEEAYEEYGSPGGDDYGDDDIDEDSESSAKPKGIFGLFKKKQPKRAKSQEYELDDEDSMDDIFEDLDEE